MSPTLERAHRGNDSSRLGCIIFVGIVAFLIFLTITSPRGHPPDSKRRTTINSSQYIQIGLENYYTDYGEFPEPSNPDEVIEVTPGKLYRIGGAKCLYQALSGDGYDAIKGVAKNENDPQSDGRVNVGEVRAAVASDLPADMWLKVGGHYFLVDAFGRPFQYIKGDKQKQNAINDTYDLWSYGEDDKNTLPKSKDTESKPGLDAQWIKNW